MGRGSCGQAVPVTCSRFSIAFMRSWEKNCHKRSLLRPGRLDLDLKASSDSSAPHENAFPAPVKMTNRHWLSALKPASRSLNSSINWGPRGFICRGRFKVTVVVSPDFCTSRCLYFFCMVDFPVINLFDRYSVQEQLGLRFYIIFQCAYS